MTGHHSGLLKRVQLVVPAAVWQHCIIHWQALATKKMPKDPRAVLDEAVNIVNLIKSRPLNARLFSILYNEMGANFHQLLLHYEVWWLSRGKVLTRLCDLREEVLLLPRRYQLPIGEAHGGHELGCNAGLSF